MNTPNVTRSHSLPAVLVRSLRTVPMVGPDMGRYVFVTVLSQILTKNSIGCFFNLRSLAGIEETGRIVDMSEAERMGHFPTIEEGVFILDTRSDNKAQRRNRMPSGGIGRFSR